MGINITEKSNFIWKIADLLRGDYKQSEYGDVILPFTVLCRLDSVLAPSKEEVMELHRKNVFKTEYARLAGFRSITGGLKFYNISEFTFAKLKNDAGNIADNLTDYIKGFSGNARSILESFDIYTQIARLDKANLLYLVVSKFVDDIDLHPDHVSNNEMGYIFEELIRKFSEISNETAGEHFTPREVIRLMVSMLFNPDLDKIIDPGYMAKLYDPAAGTGGMLSAGIEYAKEYSPDAIIEVYGQELNEKTYAICKSDTMIKGKGYENIHLGNSFTEDKLKNETFHYMLCNPPFGVEWKKYEKFIRDEAEDMGYAGRFGAGLPRVSDGSLLFLQHMVSKMIPPENGGSRIGIVFNGSPLSNGDPGSGENEIRRWIIENGWLETIIALPDELFYNTGILTYVWIVTNRKKGVRKNKIQLIDGTSFFDRLRSPLGKKRKVLTDEHIRKLVNIYGNFVEGEFCKIFDEDDFAYWKIIIERPLRLNFRTSTDRIKRIREQKTFASLATSRKRKPDEVAKEVAEGEQLQEAILVAISTIDGATIYKNRAEFSSLLSKTLKKAGLAVKAPLLKAILAALSEKDETADICTDVKGNPEPDTDLRDTDQIPLKEDIAAYFEREVLPYAPDAWVDESKTKKGYEIPFTRHFFEYSEVAEYDEYIDEIELFNNRIHATATSLFSTAEIITRGLDATVPLKSNVSNWLGSIPQHWNILPLFTVASENKTKNTGNICDNLLSLSYGRVIRKDIETTTGLLPESFEGYQIVESGYTIMRLTDMQNDKHSLRTGYVTERGIITSAYLGLVPMCNNIKPQYFSLLLHAYDLKKVFYAFGNGIRQTLKFSDIKRLPVLIPPIDEQEAIIKSVELRSAEIKERLADLYVRIEELVMLTKSTLLNE